MLLVNYSLKIKKTTYGNLRLKLISTHLVNLMSCEINMFFLEFINYWDMWNICIMLHYANQQHLGVCWTYCEQAAVGLLELFFTNELLNIGVNKPKQLAEVW